MTNDFFRFKQFTIYQDKCSFKVGTDGVLLGAAADVTNVMSILDIGSGTGLISIMLAQRTNASIVALEPDVESFNQLNENVSACKWSGRIEAVNSSLQNYKPAHKFDLIVSNPPYFISSLKNIDYRKSFSRHNDSLTHEDLLKGAETMLQQDGKFQVILPYNEGMKLVDLARGTGFFCNSIMNIKPTEMSGVKRVILTFSRAEIPFKESLVMIETGIRHHYSAEYITLTKDFYLDF